MFLGEIINFSYLKKIVVYIYYSIYHRRTKNEVFH